MLFGWRAGAPKPRGYHELSCRDATVLCVGAVRAAPRDRRHQSDERTPLPSLQFHYSYREDALVFAYRLERGVGGRVV